MPKSFKENLNPTLQFISNTNDMSEKSTNNDVTISNESIPVGYKLNPKYIETKSKRVQLLIKPSTHESLKKIAQKNNISVNELINNILEKHISK